MHKVILFLLGGAFLCYPLVGCTQVATVQESPPTNVLLLVVDTLRTDVLSCYGGKEIQTPNIDSLAADGLLFERAISSAPWTVPAMASILTGLSPLTHKAEAGVKYSGDIQSLQVRLKRHG